MALQSCHLGISRLDIFFRKRFALHIARDRAELVHPGRAELCDGRGPPRQIRPFFVQTSC